MMLNSVLHLFLFELCEQQYQQNPFLTQQEGYVIAQPLTFV